MMFPKPQKRQKKRKYSSLPRTGKKTNQWEACKKLLKPAFADVGITRCEITPVLANRGFDVSKIRSWFFLTWAHGDKRDNLVGNELLSLVALCCVDAHNIIEKMPRSEMRSIVEEAMARRSVQPATVNMEVPNA